MAGFLYFVVGESKLAVQDLPRVGLDYAFESSISHRAATAHDLQKQGVVACDPDLLPPKKTAGYLPDEQTWRKMPREDDGPELYLGFWTEHPPQPDELRRQTPLRTHGVKLDDGRLWDVPIIGHPEGTRLETDLPAWLDLDDAGRRIRGQVLEEYQRLWDTVAAVADAQLAYDAGERAEPPTDEQQWRAVIACLQAVYRVDICEVVAMRAFLESSPTLAVVWMIVANYQWLLDVLEANAKKNGSAIVAGRNTSVGATA